MPCSERQMKLYLDIDGVILTKNKKVPDGAPELISFVLKYFDCHWLTTHCRAGANRAIEYLSDFYQAEELDQLKKRQSHKLDG